MVSMNSLLSGDRQRRYSVERLRVLYADLLQRIDVADLERRAREETAATSPRFAFRKSLFQQKETDENDERKAQRKRDLVAAFRVLAATRSADKEGNNGGAIAVRTDASVSALTLARSLAESVANCVREIGEVVVNAEKPSGTSSNRLRGDDTFEYFCEKAILALFVDIVKEKPACPSRKHSGSCFHGVVWSPLVKAQILHTVSVLVSGVRDPSALYYILSQNCVNQLIACMLPLKQWTDPALEVMLPAYVDLLKNLALQLGASPHLFPFFTVQDGPEVFFPLFSATLETGTSSFAQSNSFVHSTCLNLIVDLMQSTNPSIRDWVCQAEREQRYLADHLCQLFLRRYQQTINLTTGPVVDGIRSNAVVGQLAALNDQIDALNDIFCCGIKGLNVRLCETFLRRVLSFMLTNLAPSLGRKLLEVGDTDCDVIPEPEAAAQVSAFFLARLFLRLEYAPLVRMVAVALFHPKSTPLWKTEELHADEYILTPALNKLVQGMCENSISNPFREEVDKALRGDHGEWRVASAAMILENALKSNSLDNETLKTLDLLPQCADDLEYVDTSVEVALATYLERHHSGRSAVSTMSLECTSSLALHFIHKTVFMKSGGEVLLWYDTVFKSSPVWRALQAARDYFFRQTLESQHAIGVSDIFVDIIESAVQNRYKRITTSLPGIRGGPASYTYILSQHGCAVHCSSSEALVRKMRTVSLNDVEATRFYAAMAVHFRATCRVIDRFYSQLQRSNHASSVTPPKSSKEPKLRAVDPADELARIFGSLREKPSIGTDLDLRGRMSFRCSSQIIGKQEASSKNARGQVDAGRVRTLSDDMIYRSDSHLVLILDPVDLFIARPVAQSEVNRGTVLCCVPLLNVIAAAADGSWLHVAVKHDDVGFLIKGGNMMLHFDTPGSCLIVCQYLDRCRSILRRELLDKIEELFGPVSDSESQQEVLHVQSY